MKDNNKGRAAKHPRNRKTKQRIKSRNRLLVLIILLSLAVFVCINTLADNHRTVKNVTSVTGDKQGEVKEDTWYLILVNKRNPIPKDYSVELTKLNNGQTVDKRIYPALQDMFDAARGEGLNPVVVSGYRTAEKQQRLMNEKISEYKGQGYSEKKAKAKAEAWVAIPGTSEHQLGIAVDINADAGLPGDAVYDWLNQNGYKYGFIHRYQDDKKKITGVINEPWHYRYVGKKAAAEMYEQGVCLEEYLDR